MHLNLERFHCLFPTTAELSPYKKFSQNIFFRNFSRHIGVSQKLGRGMENIFPYFVCVTEEGNNFYNIKHILFWENQNNSL